MADRVGNTPYKDSRLAGPSATGTSIATSTNIDAHTATVTHAGGSVGVALWADQASRSWRHPWRDPLAAQ